ncbi:Na+/H+ antiporter subunit E [Pseudonocardia broussonetiae]|uniref:Na+/H+ antiporter subunit E n=1 Tax=Pseudonocardia broussonetiae TaxID=2736640 RepID=A0A6M6JS79_9PSEU|nr:Na+/H+ antiporter subunit E [Pseudonocardia broussonetiae]QJY50215.1 Na+/H+ antiporter subunit E [Pseudonocardia broussonetiae]
MTRALSIAWLTVVWVLLWGSFTLLTVVGGVLVGWVVTVVWRPGDVDARLPFRPLPFLGLVAFLARDLVVSSFVVSRETLLHGPRSRGAILDLPLLSTSDRVVAMIAGAYSLSPGTLVLQIDLQASRWFIYVIGTRDTADVEQARKGALEVQRRVLDALGSPSERAAARELEASG